MPKPIAFRATFKAEQTIDRIMKEQKLSQSQAVIYALENFQSEPQTPFSPSDLKGKKVELKHLIKMVPCPKYDCWVNKEQECKGCRHSQICVMRP